MKKLKPIILNKLKSIYKWITKYEKVYDMGGINDWKFELVED